MIGWHVQIIHVRLYLWICISEYCMYLHVAKKEIDVTGLKNSPKITTENMLADAHRKSKFCGWRLKKKTAGFQKPRFARFFFGRSHREKWCTPSFIFASTCFQLNSTLFSIMIQCSYSRTWACGCRSPYICIYIYIYVHVGVHIYICIYIYNRCINMYVCIYLYICVYIYVYILCKYSYINEHIHINICTHHCNNVCHHDDYWHMSRTQCLV